ncbi:hypothetical protein ACFOVU_11380 [Nocardiopsis sediminis]|uniref:Uncharacterized protein n=1 Tax=Nocardiopsis sediminis TaxID=1778267 RepID=A0ABV8FNH0_9ACTN
MPHPKWDAWTDTGEYLYLRYRWVTGTVNRGDVDGPIIPEFEHGGPHAGTITLDEFASLTIAIRPPRQTNP